MHNTINNQINVLILCATNASANLNPTRLHNNIDYIVKNYIKGHEHNIKIYYMGIDLTHDLENNKCESYVDNMISTCNYTRNMFDIILSEYCPSYTVATAYTPTFFKLINYLLKQNGIFSIKKPIQNKISIRYGNKISTYTYDNFFKNIEENYLLSYKDIYNVYVNVYVGTNLETWAIIHKVSNLEDIDPKNKLKSNNKLKANNKTIPHISIKNEPIFNTIPRKLIPHISTKYIQSDKLKNVINFITY